MIDDARHAQWRAKSKRYYAAHREERRTYWRKYNADPSHSKVRVLRAKKFRATRPGYVVSIGGEMVVLPVELRPLGALIKEARKALRARGATRDNREDPAR